jgi:hypothetical protein
MHGVWSWVSDSVRLDIITFIGKFLKPNGLFYISYDSMPGWAQILPFHKIMSLYTKDKKCSLTEKAEAAVSYMKFLEENKSQFFEYSPYAKLFLRMLEKSDIRYVIHELFNKNLRPEYFCDVAEEMRKVSLSFIGDSEHINNYQITMPEAFRKLLSTASDKISLETHKSIMQNDRFRKDIYAKCESTPPAGYTPKYFENFLFGSLKQLSDLRLETKLKECTITLNADPYLKIFDMLSKDQLSIYEINKKLGRSEDKINLTIENIKNCMLTGQFIIFLQKKKAKKRNKLIFSSEYNLTQVINWEEQYSKDVFLASEIIGDAFAISKQTALILSAIYKFGFFKKKVVDHVCGFVRDNLKQGRNAFGFSQDQDIEYLISFHYEETVNLVMKTLIPLGVVC